MYGPSTIAHVIGAWQIYEHSGNETFLAKSYEFYKTLFWDGIGGKHFGFAYHAVLCLNKMATILGFPQDAIHWNSTVGMDNIQHMLENNWEKDTPGWYGATKNGMGWSQVAPAGGMSMFFPRQS